MVYKDIGPNWHTLLLHLHLKPHVAMVCNFPSHSSCCAAIFHKLCASDLSIFVPFMCKNNKIINKIN
jgi:hypothetical protein